MASLIDVKKLIEDLTKITDNLDKVLEGVADGVAAKIVEDLKSEAYDISKGTGKAYENLELHKGPADTEQGVYEYKIVLDDKHDWAEKGTSGGWMGEFLLKGGQKSRVIPIHNDFSDIANSKPANNSNKEAIQQELMQLSSAISAADLRGSSGYSSKFKMSSVSGTSGELHNKEGSDKVSATTETFRTITKESKDKSWMRKPKEGAKLLENLESTSEKRVSDILQSILDKN